MKTITIQTKYTTYQMGVHPLGYLLHLYYGEKTEGDMSYLLLGYDRGFSGNPYDAGEDRTLSLDVLPQEYPCYGTGDFRSPACNVRDENGVSGLDLRYQRHSVRPGKYGIMGMPAVYEREGSLYLDDDAPSVLADGADTTELDLCSGRYGTYTVDIVLADRKADVEVLLRYGILPELDVITRSAVIKNTGKTNLYVNKGFSSTLDFLTGDYDLLHFHGRHTMERNLERIPVIHGKQSFGSRRGTSSHQHNPFAILAKQGTTEDYGGCYGMMLLYSGNFSFEAEQDQYHQVRMQIGMSDEMMDYLLVPEECLRVPEAVMVYTADGLAVLSHRYHKLVREHICRGVWRDVRRPILINNWEATYFHFNGEKIRKLAEQAAELGVELLVLDDGWFGKRDDDNSGLGDWTVNEEKLGGTLSELSESIHGMGMKFGLWIEPEMVNEDSNLYRAHPDWAFQIPGRRPCRCRNQLVLDFSRKEVVDHVFTQIVKVVDSARIEYIKMDMNRSLCDIYTWSQDTASAGGYQNYGKIMHKYVLGVYDFMERLTGRYPHILIEGCSGGGGRFDAGMLYYSPQIWCSDDTDAIERIQIQHGTSFGYPVSSMGSHVSAVPNHQTGRMTALLTRSTVAMAGSFGYELDPELLTDQEKEEIRKQIQDYKKYWKLIHHGVYYRLHNPGKDTEAAAWCFVSEDQKELLLSVVSLNAHGNAPLTYIRCRGILPDGSYRCLEENRKVKPWTGEGPRRDKKQIEGCIFAGSTLMYAGLPVPVELGEYGAMQLYFRYEEK